MNKPTMTLLSFYAMATGVFVLVIGLLFQHVVIGLVLAKTPDATWVPFFYSMWVVFTGVGLMACCIHWLVIQAISLVISSRRANPPEQEAE